MKITYAVELSREACNNGENVIEGVFKNAQQLPNGNIEVDILRDDGELKKIELSLAQFESFVAQMEATA